MLYFEGILSLIESECLLGNSSTDGGLVRKLHKMHGKNKHPNYSECGPSTKWKDPFTGAMTNDNQFVIRHYAGNIIYTCEHFLDKNKDTLHDSSATIQDKKVCWSANNGEMSLKFTPSIGKSGTSFINRLYPSMSFTP